MNPQGNFLARWCILGATAILLLAVYGCGSRPSQRKAEENASPQNSASPASGPSGPNLDLNCVIDHIQNPPEAFHYSYKKDGSNPVNQQADVTPQTIDGTILIAGNPREFHGVRTDQQSWQTAWSNLMGIAGMSSTIALVNHSSAMVREGAENVNGYDTTRFSIDTARGSAAEAGLYRSTLGDGGFEKGTVWVTSQGCPAKLSLDSEMHLRDGSVDKIHYEIEMIKK